MAAAELYDAPEPRRYPCPDCHGSGQSAAIHPACEQCDTTWTPSRFDAWLDAYDHCGWRGVLAVLFPRMRTRTRWDTLPCWHDIAHLAYRSQPCRTCAGVGTIAHLTLSEDLWRAVARPRPRPLRRARLPHLAPVHTRTPIRLDPPVPPLSCVEVRRVATHNA